MTRRKRFFFSHLVCSFIIIVLVGATVLTWWFPIPYRFAAGGIKLLTILALVDVVLGPLMTLYLVKPEKNFREITLDLCFVAFLQLCALTYGIHSIFVARPVHTVFEIDRFKGISASDVITEDLSYALPIYRHLPIAGPTLIAANKAATYTEADVVNALSLALGGFDISSQPKRWAPYASTLPEVLKRSKPATLLADIYPALHKKLQALAKSENVSLDQLRFLPMVIHKAQWTAVLSPDASRILDYYHVDGFIDEKKKDPPKAEKEPARPQ